MKKKEIQISKLECIRVEVEVDCQDTRIMAQDVPLEIEVYLRGKAPFHEYIYLACLLDICKKDFSSDSIRIDFDYGKPKGQDVKHEKELSKQMSIFIEGNSCLAYLYAKEVEKVLTSNCKYSSTNVILSGYKEDMICGCMNYVS